MSFYIAVDAGFTNTRVAVVKSGEVIAYATSATPGRCDKGVDGSNADALQERWLCHLVAQVKSQLSSEGACLGIGISFAGVVSQDGSISKDSAIWGSASEGIELADLERRLGFPVRVANDVSAACYRYAFDFQYMKDERISLINIGSGIGAKTYLRSLDAILLDSKGRTGEIGLAIVDPGEHALASQTGKFKGALNNYSSGTGFARFLGVLAQQCPDLYESSLLKRALKMSSISIDEKSGAALNRINKIAIKCLNDGDIFVSDALDRSVGWLSIALQHVILLDSPDRIILCGGFVSSIGPSYRDRLVAKLVPHLNYLYSEEEIMGMVRLGNNDDLDNLLGIAEFCKKSLSQIGE
ncbi:MULTISPECIES: ROK family protein [Pseudomonas]|jgi:predicted NBD/HSP70 family sugar kinase|uniref:ROK family protein n=1 Tax=Pseudomonas TaxID=286 RepID=UPI000357B441|nr:MULTISPECIES: ROK family protein [Pseudomonas]OKP67352.1 c7-cyclitol-7-kinase [Pseudomonas fluorescens]EPJ80516.1 c7-cyclitol-7-kinase gacm [Pseudomonas sp. CFT9]EPL09661.1 c7-cyclitol-7-kinase gacm [Pseudomonas sp. CF150]MCF5512242.1 ROK family protein [Pseudomonas sp. PA-3-6H]MCF5564997.1 ROK family protein [Pseudomonas sp. PA-3-5D]